MQVSKDKKHTYGINPPTSASVTLQNNINTTPHYDRHEWDDDDDGRLRRPPILPTSSISTSWEPECY